jgi:hypothetical protein
MAIPSQRQLTVGTLVKRGQGVNLFCACGHKTALLPEQVAKLAHPEMRLLDLKRRMRCTMCGRSGGDDDVRISLFAVPAIIGGGDASEPRTRH